MRISDWSSDVCSSDLTCGPLVQSDRLARVPCLLRRSGNGERRARPRGQERDLSPRLRLRDRQGRAWRRGIGGVPSAHDQRPQGEAEDRSEEHTSELQSLMRISYAVFCLKKKKNKHP